MNYEKYLKNKNLSNKTIDTYKKNVVKYLTYLKDKNITKSNFVKFLNHENKKLSANTVRLLYSSVLSYLKYKKMWKLYNEFQDIKLPKIVVYNRTTISLDEYNNVKDKIILSTWYNKRDWIIFSFLFLTGIRGFEINQIEKKKIIDNKIKIVGKNNKERFVFIPEYLNSLLNNWKYNCLNINKSKKKLTHKQLNIIVKRIGIKYFEKNISCHSLRRSYATNLLRKNVDIKTVSTFLGHSNINTTSRYLYLSTDEMIDKLKTVF